MVPFNILCINIAEIYRLKKVRPSFYPAIGWLIITTVLLVLPGSAFPKQNWLTDIQIDKWVHIVLFAVMVILCCWGILVKIKAPHLRLKYFTGFALIAIAYGTGMEFVQKYFVANRSFDNGDIIADSIGSFAGLLFSWGRYIKK